MMASSISRRIRLASMLCDHVIMCALYLVPFACFVLLRGGWQMYNPAWQLGCLLALYLNKDFFNGRSPAKRLFRLQVVDARGRPANEWRCLVRNLTFFVWPLEVLVLAAGRRKRLGDVLAGTHIVSTPEGAASWWQDLRAYRLTRYSWYAAVATPVYLLVLDAFNTHVLGL